MNRPIPEPETKPRLSRAERTAAALEAQQRKLDAKRAELATVALAARRKATAIEHATAALKSLRADDYDAATEALSAAYEVVAEIQNPEPKAEGKS